MLFIKNIWFVLCQITRPCGTIKALQYALQPLKGREAAFPTGLDRDLPPVEGKKWPKYSIFAAFSANPLFNGSLLLILQRGAAVPFIKAAAEMAGGGEAHLGRDFLYLQLTEFQKLRRGEQAVSQKVLVGSTAVLFFVDTVYFGA